MSSALDTTLKNLGVDMNSQPSLAANTSAKQALPTPGGVASSSSTTTSSSSSLPASSTLPTSSNSNVVINQLSPSVTTYSAPFKRSGLVEVGIRMTVMKLANNDLVVYNPIQLDDSVSSSLSSLNGNIKYVIAPNLVHHIYLDDFAKRYPKSILIGPQGMQSKHKDLQNVFIELKDGEEGKQSEQALGWPSSELAHAYFPHFAQKEIWLCHLPSKTLCVADMMWNLPANEQYMKASEEQKHAMQHKGIIQSFVDKRINPDNHALPNMQWALNKNDESFQNQLNTVYNVWQPTTIIPEHGDTITSGALDKLKNVFAWAFQKK